MQGFLEANENAIIFGGLIAGYLLAALWEEFWPRRRIQSNLRQRWSGNIGLLLINQVLIFWLDAAVIIGLAWLAATWQTGLFAATEVNFFVALAATMVGLEATTYIVHRLLHQVPVLWQFHAVHHSDTELDFTTTGRNHPFELVTAMVASIPVLALLSPPVAVVVVYQVIRGAVIILAHSNVYLPEKIDRWLRYVVITPDFHRMHHSDDPRFTNSNYGAFVPWFDYLFGTATRKPFEEQPVMPLGLEYFRAPDDSRLDRLLLMPFRHQPTAAERAGQTDPDESTLTTQRQTS